MTKGFILLLGFRLQDPKSSRNELGSKSLKGRHPKPVFTQPLPEADIRNACSPGLGVASSGRIISEAFRRRYGAPNINCLTCLARLIQLATMTDSSNKLGKYLARTRTDAKLSLRAVEAETGVSNAYLSQLETGKIKTPSPSVLHTLAERYQISYAHLMELAGYPIPETGQPRLNTPSSQFAARLGVVTPDEEDALVDFLELIRKRDRGRQ